MSSQSMLGRALGVVLGMLALTFLLATSGCNTIKGAGEDVQAAGSAVSSGAQKTEDKIKESTESAE